MSTARGLTKADLIRKQITDLEADKAALVLNHATKLAGLEARISQAKAILGMFVTTRRPKAPKVAAPPAVPGD